MIGYVKCFDSNKTMPFKVSDKKVVKKVNQNMVIVNLFMMIVIDK